MNLDEVELQSDPKYRNYVTAVEKALKGFEYSSEWADLISALGKLIKVLQANSRFQIIPKRLLIGKRLAQCTHPALPSGVHLKAMETYDLIFKTIGPKLLCQDMFIYSAGIFPLLGYAAMPVKPVLLNLYEEHYLPLGEHLKPSLTGLLQGILPGLEEGSDNNDRTQTLLEQLCAGMVKSNFYSALWDCVLHNPSVRLPAIAFVLSQVDRKTPMKEQAYIMGNNKALLVESVCSSLYDSVALVQRNILDLILVLFPIHDACIPADKIIKILTASLNVLLRRDMSLNRRLYAWLLGTDTKSNVMSSKPETKHKRSDSNITTDSILSLEDETCVYFETHSRGLLIYALKVWLHRTPQHEYTEKKSSLLKPYRLLISLIDKPEVSATIIDDIFIEVFRALYNRCTRPVKLQKGSSKVKKGSEVKREVLHGPDRPTELIKTANLLFGTFEAYFMWDFIARKFESCCQASVLRSDGNQESNHGDDEASILTCSELCTLVDFLLDIVTLETYIETPTEYLPQLLCKITMSLTNYCTHLSLDEINDGLHLCAKLLTKVQPSMVLSPEPVDDGEGGGGEETSGNRYEDWELIEDARLQIGKGAKTGSKFTPPTAASVKSKSSVHSLDRMVGSVDGGVETESNGERIDGENHNQNHVGRVEGRVKTTLPVSPERTLDRLSSDPNAEMLQKDAEEEEEEDGEVRTEKAKRPTHVDSLSLHSDGGSDVRQTMECKIRTGSISSLSASLTESERETAPVFLMQACVQCFQSFFYKFVSHKILSGPDIIKDYISKLQVGKRAGLDARIPCGDAEDNVLKLPKGLDELIERDQPENGRIRTDSMLTNDSATADYLDDVMLECDSTSTALQAFGTACHLLVEFACFPMYCNETVATLLKTPKIKGNVLSLPDWLQSLLACCCFVYSFAMQSTAISTTIELIGLTKSVTGGTSNSALVLPNPPNSPKVDSGTISVVLIPAISTSYLDCLNYSTNFFQRVSVNLWHQLGSRTPDHHQRSSDLLHQLHNVTPDVFICEDVIGNSLVQNNKVVSLESHSKFATLWHLVRSQILGSSPASKLRTFDRSLFVMLDSLEHHDCMVRSVTQTWLIHAINRGDIARILEPILLVLLHPTVARVSVQFLQTRAQQEKERKELAAKVNEDQDAAENRIYSISSINGEVKYYVVKDGKRALTISPGNKDPVFACTALDDKQKYVTKTNSGLRYTTPAPVINKTLSVTVNPMSQQAYCSDSDSSDHSNNPMKVPPLMMTKSQSFDERNLRRFSTPASSVISISSAKKGGGGERRRSDQSSPPSSQSLTDDKLSHSVSTDDLSDGEMNYEEPSYFYNEEVDETVEDAVRGVVSSLIDAVAIQVDGQEEFDRRAMKDKELPETMTPRRLPGLLTQGGVQQGEKLSPDDIGLDDLESAMSGLETEHSDVEGLPSSSLGVKTKDVNVDDTGAKLLTGLKLNTVHPLQQHLLLYVQVYDAQRMLYVLATLKSILNTNPRPFVCAMSSTSISSTNTPQLIKLQQVLARHKRCVTGRDFYCEMEPEGLTPFRSSTYLEIVILICVYFMRSYYPLDLKANQSDVQGNRDVQIASMEVLGQILHELVDVVKDSGRGLATFISDLMSRCKVQKAVLYCILATVYHSRKKHSKHNNSKEKDIIQDVCKDLSDKGAQSFQVQLLRLSHTIIILEDQLFTLKDDTDPGIHTDNEWEFYRIKYQSHNSSLAFIRTARFACQGILLTGMLSALKQHHNSHMHSHWVALVTDSLPYLENGLPKIAIPVTNQLCRNLEILSSLYMPHSTDSNRKSEADLDNVPPDHVINMLEGLTSICHFCLLESTSSLSAMSGRHTGASSTEPESNTSAPLFSGLFGALTRDRTKGIINQSSNQSNTPKSEARKGLLGMLPRIIASVAKLWANVQKCEKSRDATRRSEEATSLSFGSPRSARQQIMELLSPIALHHATNLLAAIGVVWSDCKKRNKVKQTKVIPVPSSEQLVLVELVSAIRALPSDTLVQTIKQVLKAPPFTIKDKNQPGLEVSMLQFLYCYIQRMTVSPLKDSWHSLLALLKEGVQLNLNAPGQFLLLGILNEIIPKISPFEERKEQRELQEICNRLIEACNLIAGSSLEQTTWLRRNVYVKIQEEQQADSDASDSPHGADSPTEVTEISSNPDVLVNVAQTSTAITKSYSQYSVQALTHLAELLSQMLDLVYQSDEKEKVVPLLTAIMHNVTPYLKNHSAPNMPSYRACTALVSSLSGYQYTRRSWKRDAFELLLDPGFFQMDAKSIRGWRTIIDNLMTHDKTTFRDLMARVAAFQNTSLNPFSSREAEMDQRGQLLKRLSYTLFCSEVNQYVRALPDIQERLSESLRLSQVPSVHEQVFLCFRVLLLRISPHHLTGLWPTMISEMVQVFLYLEEQLSSLNVTPDTSKKSAFKRVANSDFANFLLGNSNTPKGLSSIPKAWLGLYLAACKLLDLALCLPSDDIPQFQVYKWAFIGETSKKDSETQFVPHVARAAKQLRARLRKEKGVEPPAAKAPRGRPLITTHSIQSVVDLLPFFNAVCPTDQPPHDNMVNGGVPSKETGLPVHEQDEDVASYCSTEEYIESLVEKDFLVPLT